MGEPLTGAWSRKYQLQVPYVDARKWGTGISPVHRLYGGPGRGYNPKLDVNQLDGRTPANFAVAQEYVEGTEWGYQSEDVAGLDVFSMPEWSTGNSGKLNDAAYPDWESPSAETAGTIGDPPAGGAPGPKDPSVEINRAFIPEWASRPWQFTNKARLRSIRAGETEADTGWAQRGVSSQIPVEDVATGWINKGSTGGIDPGEIPDDNVMPSAYAQYERQTSMQQRKLSLENDRAVSRGTDESRSSIPSRLVPMKLRQFSGEIPFEPGVEETYRSYDMFPYQIDDIPRPFIYRTAGTGPQRYLETNEQWTRTPMQRTPPPDPSMGVPESELADTSQFGYSTEDQGYY